MKITSTLLISRREKIHHLKQIFFVVIVSLFLNFLFFLNIQVNDTFSLENLTRTGNLDAKLISVQYILDLLARFMEIKSINPKIKKNPK